MHQGNDYVVVSVLLHTYYATADALGLADYAFFSKLSNCG